VTVPRSLPSGTAVYGFKRILRALYQRRQGRDMFDLATALASPAANHDRIVAAFPS